MGAIVGKRSGKDDFWASRGPAPQVQERKLDNWTENWLDRIDRELIWGGKPSGKTVVGAQKPAAEHDASRALPRQDSRLL